MFIEFRTNSYGVTNRFVPEQNRDFSNDVFDVNDSAISRCAFLVKGPQIVDNICRTVSLLLDSSGRRSCSFQVWWIMCQPSQECIRACDRSGNGLFDFMCQRGGQFPHHVNPVDVRQISLELPQPFALLLGMLLFRYIHRDADVFTSFLRGVVMSDAPQKSDRAVCPTDPKFDIVIRAFSDRIPEFCTDNRFVFGKNRTVIVVEWNRALARIEAIQASVLVR